MCILIMRYEMKHSIGIILLIILLVGCKIDPLQEEANRKEDIANYSCDAKQLELVLTEFKICESSDYMSHYCFKQAKLSQCDYMPLEHNE